MIIPPEVVSQVIRDTMPGQVCVIYVERKPSTVEMAAHWLRHNGAVRVWGEWRQQGEGEATRDGMDLHLVGETIVAQNIHEYDGPLYHASSFMGQPRNVWSGPDLIR